MTGSEDPTILVALSRTDPVAEIVRETWGVGESIGEFLEGAPVRRRGKNLHTVERPGPHIFDERLDLRVPESLRGRIEALVFPSVHRSERGVDCLTVHPLGNLGDSAEVGGRPRTLNPTAPRLMTAALRLLAERGPTVGLSATYEATHHGPYLELPSFFVEVATGETTPPPADAVRLLASTLDDLRTEGTDRVAMAVGGGHYAPHFTDLALRRRWSFGHILSRHALETLESSVAKEALHRTTDAEGIVYARAADAQSPALRGLSARLRDQDAPRREPGKPARDVLHS